MCRALKSYFVHQHTTWCTLVLWDSRCQWNSTHRSAELHNITLQHECLGLHPQPLAVKTAKCIPLRGDPIHSKENTVIGLRQNYKINFNLLCGGSFVKGLHVYNGFLCRDLILIFVSGPANWPYQYPFSLNSWLTEPRFLTAQIGRIKGYVSQLPCS